MSDHLTQTFFAGLAPRHTATLSAALKLFVRKGFFNTSIHDIAGSAGVSIGFIYHNFGDKVGIARALYRQLLACVEEQIDAVAENYQRAGERCREVIRLLFRLTESAPEVMDFIIHARHKEFLPDEKPICSSTPFTRMQEFVYLGVETGEIRAMPPLTAAMIAYGGAIRMVCLRLDGVIAEPLETHFEDLWNNTWRALSP